MKMKEVCIARGEIGYEKSWRCSNYDMLKLITIEPSPSCADLSCELLFSANANLWLVSVQSAQIEYAVFLGEGTLN